MSPREDDSELNDLKLKAQYLTLQLASTIDVIVSQNLKDQLEKNYKNNVELYKEFIKVKDMPTLTKMLANFKASGKVASDGKGEYSRFDVRNSLNNYLARQFFPQAFLPAKEDFRKDVFSKEHTRSGLGSFLGRIEIRYTAEQLAENLSFPFLRAEVSQAVTSRKPANATVQQPSVSSSSNTMFDSRGGKTKVTDEMDNGKGKKKKKNAALRR